jgi:hypothetical protein
MCGEMEADIFHKEESSRRTLMVLHKELLLELMRERDLAQGTRVKTNWVQEHRQSCCRMVAEQWLQE